MGRFVADLAERNVPGAATDLMIALARQHFIALDALATLRTVPAAQLLDALEVDQLERLHEGP